MTKDHGFPNANRAKSAMVVVVQIRAANAARFHFDAHLTGGEGAYLAFFNPQIFGFMDNNCSHASLFSYFVVAAS
jgi:hypothetical protein